MAEDKQEPTTEATAEPTIALPSAAEIAKMQEDLSHLEKQNGELLRHLADYQNRHQEMQSVMKRAQGEMDSRLKFAHEKFAGDIVSSLDNLVRAIEAAKLAGDKSPLSIGVMATVMQISDVLKRYGVVAIESKGKPFDPNLHQAVKSEPTAGVDANTVVNVLQEGYMIHERVLRPAMVIVASQG